METSRVNLTGLAVALAAGLLILHLPESQGILASLAGLTLLVALFAFGQDIARTSAQSLAFALVCGLAALGAVSFPIRIVIGTGKTVLGQDAIPPVVWLLATAIFWFIDRSGAEPSAVQPVHLHGGTYSQPPMPVEVPKAQPYTPAPVSFVSPLPAVPEPIRTPDPEPMPVAPPPPAPVTGSTVAAAPPIPSGKEVNIYVTMVGEGMNVLRSVRAEHLGRDFYIIVDEMPADENWQFVPGQVVRCRKKSLSNGKGMVAYEEAPRAQ